MFETFRKKSADSRLTEEKLYEQVVHELTQGIKRDGLWAKAIANSDGEEERAKSLYVQYRVQSIKDDSVNNNKAKDPNNKNIIENAVFIIFRLARLFVAGLIVLQAYAVYITFKYNDYAIEYGVETESPWVSFIGFLVITVVYVIIIYQLQRAINWFHNRWYGESHPSCNKLWKF